MTEIHELLKEAYASELAEGVEPESEEALAAFEVEHGVRIPKEYRWLLKEFGACNFAAEPYLYTLEDLEWAFPDFQESYAEYKQEYELPENLQPFPIGVFGDGSTAILDLATGKVLMLIHDCAEDVPLEDIAPSLLELLKAQAENIIEFENKHN